MGKTTSASSRRALASAAPRTLSAKPGFAAWSKPFLAELAATSNVAAAARKAGVATTQAYDARRANAGFYRDWQQALCEGYDHLEMEMLHRLREGEIKRAAGAKMGVRSWDHAVALRLLTAHREATTRQRAIRNREDAEAIVQSINAKLEKMKQRRLAAAKAAK